MSKFKKLTSILLVGAFAVSLTACGNTANTEKSESGLTHYTTCVVKSDDKNDLYSVLSVGVTDDDYFVGQNGDGFIYVCDEKGNVLGAMLFGDKTYFDMYAKETEAGISSEDENDKVEIKTRNDNVLDWSYFDSSKNETQHNSVYVKDNLTVRVVSTDEAMVPKIKDMLSFKNKTDGLKYSDIYGDKNSDSKKNDDNTSKNDADNSSKEK